MVGSLVTGILLGSRGVARIQGAKALQRVTDLRIVLLLFRIGLKLEPHVVGCFGQDIGVVDALDDEDAALPLTQIARCQFSNLAIVTRVRSRGHAYPLFDRGVTPVFRETFALSLGTVERTLQTQGFSDEGAKHAIDRFRAHNERSVRAAFAWHWDEKAC